MPGIEGCRCRPSRVCPRCEDDVQAVMVRAMTGDERFIAPAQLGQRFEPGAISVYMTAFYAAA